MLDFYLKHPFTCSVFVTFGLSFIGTMLYFTVDAVKSFDKGPIGLRPTECKRLQESNDKNIFDKIKL